MSRAAPAMLPDSVRLSPTWSGMAAPRVWRRKSWPSCHLIGFAFQPGKMLLSQLLRLVQCGEEAARLVHRIIVAVDLQLGQQRLLAGNALPPLGHMTPGH